MPIALYVWAMATVAEKYAAGRASTNVLVKLSEVGGSGARLEAECRACDWKADDDITGLLDWAVSIRLVKLFIRKARAHTGATGHRVTTRITEQRDYVFNPRRGVTARQI